MFWGNWTEKSGKSLQVKLFFNVNIKLDFFVCHKAYLAATKHIRTCREQFIVLITFCIPSGVQKLEIKIDGDNI